jgi:hypothetical protein
MSLRLPESLHRALREIAKQENISANQFVTLAIAEKISALATAKFFQQRTNRVPSRERLHALLAKAPPIEPDEVDRL